jgi:hypothetical protein
MIRYVWNDWAYVFPFEDKPPTRKSEVTYLKCFKNEIADLLSKGSISIVENEKDKNKITLP